MRRPKIIEAKLELDDERSAFAAWFFTTVLSEVEQLTEDELRRWIRELLEVEAPRVWLH
jgi:hypothetical protein